MEQPLVIINATVALDRIMGLARKEFKTTGRPFEILENLGNQVMLAISTLELHEKRQKPSLFRRIMRWIKIGRIKIWMMLK